MERRLTTIVAADIVGFSRLVAADEEGTLAALRGHREALIDGLLAEYGGRVANTAGDSYLIEFPSAVEAVRCAMAVQAGMTERNADIPEDRRITYRVGINVGDVMTDGDDLLGDGVNIAARLEALAPPGGIVLSRAVRDQVRDRLELDLADLGEVSVKNIPRPVRAFQVLREGEKAVAMPRRRNRRMLSAVAMVVLALVVGGGWWWQAYPDITPADRGRYQFSLPEKPSIAVLAFDNLSGDSKQGYLSDGLTEDIIGALARLPQIFVIARNSSFVYKGKPVKVQQVAEELGVRYVLEGSVQRDGENLRVTAQLIDALSGYHVWSRRYDRKIKELFAVKDELTREIITGVGLKMVLTDASFSHGSGVRSMEAWLLGHESFALDQTNKKPEMLGALKLMEQALKIEPDSGQLNAWTSWRHSRLAFFGYVDDKAAGLVRAEKYARRAIELAPDLPDGYGALAFVHRVRGQHKLAVKLGEKALNLVPNDAGFMALLGLYKASPMTADEAVKLFETALRLNPNASLWTWEAYGDALVLAGRHAEALPVYEKGIKLGISGHSLMETHLGLAVVHDVLGDEKMARKHVLLALKTTPTLTLRFLQRATYPEPYKSRWLATLKRLGLPD